MPSVRAIRAAPGGVVLHGGGVTLSPYAVRDTFAVVALGDMGGIKLSTPSGPVWTDWQGQAVVPQVSAYGRSPVEVQTRSLPRNADINNGLTMISAGRGAVQRVEFGVTLTRRVLLTARTAQGSCCPWRLCQYRQRRVRDPGAGRWPGVPAQRAGAVRIVGQRTRDGALPAAV